MKNAKAKWTATDTYNAKLFALAAKQEARLGQILRADVARIESRIAARKVAR